MSSEKPSAVALALSGVVKNFGTTSALEGLELEVTEGEALALVGPSGCGKTTTLKLLNGLLRPDSGRVEIEGRSVRDHEWVGVRRRMGYVIQEVGLLPHWSVARNIGTVPWLERASPRAIESRVHELMDAVELDRVYASRKPSQLSGGQRQRVGIARALAAKPRFLLMDEPFGALDPLTRARLRRLVSELARASGLTLVLVTHDLDDARALADRVCVMRRGRVIESLPARDLESASDPWVREFLAATEATSRAS